MNFSRLILFSAILCWGTSALAASNSNTSLRVGAAAADFVVNNDYEIAGGIHPWKAQAQEGKLRAVAIVLEKPRQAKVAIVTCDILMIDREYLDAACKEIREKTGIRESDILINATHTHSAPSTITIHGYKKDHQFCLEVQRKIVQSVVEANSKLKPGSFHFALGEEKTVGANSRLLLSDMTIYWVGRMDDVLRPTAPFDPELPVWAFKDEQQKWSAVLFNHSTHTIGSITPGVRSPSFYGLAAQTLEEKHGAIFSFIEGASGSTHNLYLKIDDAKQRIQDAVQKTLDESKPRPVDQLISIKWPFKFKVRTFDEKVEEDKVMSYVRKRNPGGAEPVGAVFRNMRKELASQQGQERTTWLQVILIGDVALVGVPAEYFTKLGCDIKEQSPFEHTYIAELANDYVGYLPDLEGHQMGGYQTWTGFHSFAEPGTGERVAADVGRVLKQLHAKSPKRTATSRK